VSHEIICKNKYAKVCSNRNKNEFYFNLFQLGIAAGFLLPPMLVENHDDLDLVGNDLRFMFYLVAGFTSVLLIAVLVCKQKVSFLFMC
jgi:hypothetical protein